MAKNLTTFLDPLVDPIKNARGADQVWLAVGLVIPWSFLGYFCVPAIFLGIENLLMVRFFDQDEYLLVEYGTRLYKAGILPTAPASGYPKGFNFLCGLVLYPYTYFNGVSTEAVALTFRFVNTFGMAMTAYVVNVLGFRVFRSYAAGAGAAILLFLTPEYLWWSVNSRPHPFEMLLLTCAVLYALESVKREDERFLWVGVVFAGLAFGVKLGGIIVLPTICVAYLLNLTRAGFDREGLRPDTRLGNVVAIGSAVLAVGVTYFVFDVLFNFKRSSTGLSIAEEVGWRQGIVTWPFVAGAGMALLLAFAAVVVYILNRIVDSAYSSADGVDVRLGRTLQAHAFSGFLVKVGVLFVGLYTVTNFDYLIYPRANIVGILRMFLWTTLSTDHQPDTDVFAWLRFLTHTRLLGITGCVLIANYAVVEWWTRRVADPDRPLRLVAASYPLLLLGTLILGVQHRPHHYLLPVMPFFFLFGVYGVRKVADRLGNALPAAAVGTMVVCLVVGIERWPMLQERRGMLASRDTDPVVTDVSAYLRSIREDSMTVMLDDLSLYVPPEIGQIVYWKSAWREWDFPGVRRSEYQSLMDASPDLLVRGDFAFVDTTWSGYAADLSHLDEHYIVDKRWPYKTTARVSIDRSEVVVYRKRRGEETR